MAIDYSSMMKQGSVHSAVYTSEDVYRDEMERIFRKTWLFALHETEIPKVGDFKLLNLAGSSIIASRDEGNEIRLLVNRCRHRGAQVCEVARGNTKRFQCWYHGWTYDTQGKLVGLTGPEGYDDSFKSDEHGLTQIPRVQSYRGFVFASFAPQGKSLDDHLGPAKAFIDILVDASPVGQVEVKPGVVHKTVYHGNWKLVGMDGYHPHYVHLSAFNILVRRSGLADNDFGMMKHEDPFDDHSPSKTRAFPNGHAALDFGDQRRPHAAHNMEEYNRTEDGRRYVSDLIKAYGRERAEDLIAWRADPHLGVFPNLQLIGNQVRVIIPRSAGETEVLMYPVFLKGVSDSINERRLRVHESFYGPASSGSPDDAEIFERVQRALSADVDPWIPLSRGLHREQTQSDGTVTGLISDETPQRGQLQEWMRLMLAGQSAAKVVANAY